MPTKRKVVGWRIFPSIVITVASAGQAETWEDIANCSVRALRVCHHELRPAAAAAHHLAVPEEHIVGEVGGFGSRSEAEHRYVTLPL